MGRQQDGGPIFPGTEAHGLNSGWPGMSLFDYYAAHAPFDLRDAREAIRQCGHKDAVSGAQLLTMLADMRIEYAKAMLKAREATQ